MARAAPRTTSEMVWELVRYGWTRPITARLRGALLAVAGGMLAVAFATYNAADPSWNATSVRTPTNALGLTGALIADLFVQSLGLAAWAAALMMVVFGVNRLADGSPDTSRRVVRRRALVSLVGLTALAGVLSAPQPPAAWPLARGLGGFWGDALLGVLSNLIAMTTVPGATIIAAVLLGLIAAFTLAFAMGLNRRAVADWWSQVTARPTPTPVPARAKVARQPRVRIDADEEDDDDEDDRPLEIRAPKPLPKESGRESREKQKAFDFIQPGGFKLPELAMLAKPKPRASSFDEGALRQNARLLESVLAEFGVRGQIDQIRPGPVVTLYELVPAPGVKHARVVALSDDIARSMSVSACRVAVVSGRNAIGIELPNARRETVYLRDLLASADYEKASQTLPMALGETIGGEPYIADLAKMPHLLIAGTTGSGKSVGVNAMILSILYRLPPDKCRFIMIDRRCWSSASMPASRTCWRRWSPIRRRPSSR